MSEEEAKTAEETTAPEEKEEGDAAKEEESTAHFEPVVSGRILHAVGFSTQRSRSRVLETHHLHGHVEIWRKYCGHELNGNVGYVTNPCLWCVFAPR